MTDLQAIHAANTKLLRTALQESVFYNPLKRYLYKEELRLKVLLVESANGLPHPHQRVSQVGQIDRHPAWQKLLDSIIETMPPTLLSMKIGDLIDACQGVRDTEAPEPSSSPLSYERRAETALELLSWIRRFVPTIEEQEAMFTEEEGKDTGHYQDNCENLPPPKRARFESEGQQCPTFGEEEESDE
eukprot:Protomagalhaensia_sp_Gyna_25__1490@NODE_1762_length_1554_cov_530_847525_g1444_i0_p2_GENE_NODE_1762_length_1554_cov_530_847525_g1444_i0NODE_1762_length_1554_cov_530_847525_g1444_i0_p2_ORF_typecomplete_len187_score34_08_NODE_1762_length_1554_cov_530_847525_g1444_i0115675